MSSSSSSSSSSTAPISSAKFNLRNQDDTVIIKINGKRFAVKVLKNGKAQKLDETVREILRKNATVILKKTLDENRNTTRVFYNPKKKELYSKTNKSKLKKFAIPDQTKEDKDFEKSIKKLQNIFNSWPNKKKKTKHEDSDSEQEKISKGKDKVKNPDSLSPRYDNKRKRRKKMLNASEQETESCYSSSSHENRREETQNEDRYSVGSSTSNPQNSRKNKSLGDNTNKTRTEKHQPTKKRKKRSLFMKKLSKPISWNTKLNS